MEVSALKGPAILPHLEKMARLRLEVLAEWPYLYESTLEEQVVGLREELEDARAAAFIAIEDDQIVAMSTAIWLRDAEPVYHEPFRVKGLDEKSVCLFGESLVLRSRRGRGFGRRFMEAREEFARSMPEVRWAAFTQVLRSKHDPRKPADARDLEPFWQRHGFLPIEGLTLESAWRDRGDPAESVKPLQFWMRHLAL